jgi:hypothetical protein
VGPKACLDSHVRKAQANPTLNSVLPLLFILAASIIRADGFRSNIRAVSYRMKALLLSLGAVTSEEQKHASPLTLMNCNIVHDLCSHASLFQLH